MSEKPPHYNLKITRVSPRCHAMLALLQFICFALTHVGKEREYNFLDEYNRT